MAKEDPAGGRPEFRGHHGAWFGRFQGNGVISTAPPGTTAIRNSFPASSRMLYASRLDADSRHQHRSPNNVPLHFRSVDVELPNVSVGQYCSAAGLTG